MDFIFELLFQFAGEILLQIVWELLVEFGLDALIEVAKHRRERNPVLASIGYLLLGFLAGGVSLAIFPHSFVRSSKFHGASLIVTPLATGFVMSRIGVWRRRHKKKVMQLDSFGYGCSFAFGMALIRFLFAK